MREDTTYSDEELIKLCKKRDPEAQKIIFESYKKEVMVICKRYSRNTDDSNDCCQDSFIKVYEGLLKTKKIDSLGHWIRTITINTCINFYHKRKIRDHDSVISEKITDGQFKQILENIAIQELTTVINSLPDGYRLIFNLYIIDGYSHQEIAERLKITESTSRSQLSKAKKYLKMELGKLGIKQYERAI